MWRFLFLLYSIAAWEMFLFQPLLSINLLLIGFVAFGLHSERRNDSAVDADESESAEGSPTTPQRF